MTAASAELRMKTEALVNTVNRQVPSEDMLAWAQLSTHYPLMTIMETNERVLFTAAIISEIFGYKIKNTACSFLHTEEGSTEEGLSANKSA